MEVIHTMEPIEFDEPLPEFNAEQMLRLVQKDAYLKFVFDDLSKKGHTQPELLEVLFNSNVLEDSIYTAEYEACAL
jgi:hypothetical protein